MDSILSMTRSAQAQFLSAQPIKHFFVAQRKPQGVEENELTVSFKGPRTGLASILASTGSGGAAEYLPNDSIIAVYAATRQPQQLFEGITDQLSKLLPVFRNNIADPESQIGISFSNDLLRAIGTESAFAIEGISTTGPVWTLALLVNDSSMLDATIRKLANSINGESEREGKAERVMIEEEAIDGRTWMTMKISARPFAVTWTYDRGYLVAASDRGAAARAIATRNGGSPLVWSPAFQQQLSASAGLHPSGFAWLNTKGTLSSFASLVPNPVIRKLIAERDPLLVTFSGTTEQIRVVSRTRLSGMVMNLLLQGLGGARAGSQTANMQSSSRQ
jgi:hypothetical protein